MKNLYLYLITSSLLLVSSCDKFLDVKPAKDVASEALLKNRKGYEAALAGLYFNMGSMRLYGCDLQFGLIDVLAGYWDVSNVRHRYHGLNNYNYNLMEGTLSDFWSHMYNIIFNANNIINTLESNTNLSSDEKLILGEAIGIRAYVHLDLFRLYGPVLKQEGLSAKSPPYRKKINAVVEPFIPASEFINNLIEDLKKAESLLENDPILFNGGTTNGNPSGAIDYNSLLDRRRIRFNLNAATGLLARVYQLNDDHTNARAYALLTLKNSDASFVRPIDLNISMTADIRLTKEIVFGLYLRNHYQDSRELFGIDGVMIIPDESFYINYDQMNSFIYDNPGDYRRNVWFQNTMNHTVLVRYAKPPQAQDAFLAFRPEVSLISIAELHYIIAESYLQSEPQKTIEYLNIVLENRGSTSLLDHSAITPEIAKEELIKEARRQYFGEGQLFFFLKRQYMDIEKSESQSTKAALDIYKLPINKTELDFNN